MDLLSRLDNYMLSADKSLDESILDLLSTMDLDGLDEYQIQYIDEIFDQINDTELLNERTEKVVRKGKKTRRKVCKSGYKAKDGKCVKMSSQEKRARSKGAKRGSKKKRSKQSSISRRQKKSMKRR